MTQLIYRGISHGGTQATFSRSAQDLIYRGIRHDGLTPPAPVDRSTFTLRYRGTAHGAPVATAPGAADATAAAMA